MDNKKGNGGALAVILAGLVDAALAAVLLLLLLAPAASAEKTEASLAADFTENADNYGQTEGVTAEYPSAGTVSYVGAAPAARPQTEPVQEPAADVPAEPEERSEYEGFVFPDSNVTELSDSRIAAGANNAASCRRAINELYARHGYAFSKQENIDFFSSYGWYKNMQKESDMNKVYGQFNSVEKKNLEKLQAYEKANGWN